MSSFLTKMNLMCLSKIFGKYGLDLGKEHRGQAWPLSAHLGNVSPESRCNQPGKGVEEEEKRDWRRESRTTRFKQRREPVEGAEKEGVRQIEGVH